MTKTGESTSHRKVLIVEDHKMNMRMFTDILEAHGYEVVQATDGEQGCAMAKEHGPDLILMDIQLPGMSGLQATEWLKRDEGLRNIPVVALTAFAMKGEQQAIRDVGCDGYVSKPFTIRGLVETVERHIGAETSTPLQP